MKWPQEMHQVGRSGRHTNVRNFGSAKALYGIRLITYRFEHKRKVHERSTSSVPQSLRHCITGFRITRLLTSAEMEEIFTGETPAMWEHPAITDKGIVYEDYLDEKG